MALNESQPEKLLLTSREAAAALEICERSLFSLTKAGRIPAVRLGRSVRYSLDALRACIAQMQSPAAATPQGDV